MVFKYLVLIPIQAVLHKMCIADREVVIMIHLQNIVQPYQKHIFRLWKEARVPRENTHTHREKTTCRGEKLLEVKHVVVTYLFVLIYSFIHLECYGGEVGSIVIAQQEELGTRLL